MIKGPIAIRIAKKVQEIHQSLNYEKANAHGAPRGAERRVSDPKKSRAMPRRRFRRRRRPQRGDWS